MPVWWGTFAYMIIISAFGIAMYKSKVENAPLGPVDDSSHINYKSIGLFFAFATFALLVFFVGQRSYMFDTTDYQYAYDNYYTGELSQITDILNGTFEQKGPLFHIILILFKHFTNGTYNNWFTFVAILQGSSIALLFYKYSINFTFSVYLFFTTSYFLWFVNGMRQSLAIAFVVFFVDWVKERKTIPFIIVLIFAYWIHSSVIFWLPVYFVINYNPWSKKFIFFSVVIALALFIYSRSSWIDDSEYGYLLDNSNLVGVNPIRVFVMSVPSIIAFVYRKNIAENAPPFVKIWVNLSVITSECYVVAMFTSGTMGRMPGYFQIFNYLLLPWLFKNAIEEKTRRMIVLCACLGFFAYFCYDMYFAGNGIYNSTVLNLHYN